MNTFEKLILAVVMVVCIAVGGYFLTDLSTPVHGAGTSDLGRIVTSVGSVDYSGFQTLTPNSTTASSLTPTLANQEKAFITLETGNIRFRVDGTDPTTSVGHKLDAGQNLTLNTRGQINNLKVISISTHGVLSISYGR